MKSPSASAPNRALRTALLYGSITGMLCFAWVLFLYFSGNNPYGPKRFLSAFFPPIAAVATQVVLRYYYKTETLGLWKSIGVGMLTTVVAALVASVTFYLFSRITGPSLIEQYLIETRHLLESTKELYLKEADGLQQYNAKISNLAHTSAGFAQDEFFWKAFFGVLLSIPSGIFLRK